MARGGKVVEVGEHCLPIDGALHVEISLKQLWDIGGFPAHQAFWDEFKKVRPILEKTMADLGFTPPNGAAPERAVILPMRSAGVRYAVVIASPQDTRDTEFNPVSGVSVKVGSARRVVNLVTGESLPVANGMVTVDLINEPAAMLALLDQEPTAVKLVYPPEVHAGTGTIELSAEVLPFPAADFGIPLGYSLVDGSGTRRATFYRLSGSTQKVQYRLAANEPAGDWTVSVTDLLTGRFTHASIKILPIASVAAVAPAPPVYLPHADRVPLFLSRKDEVHVIVEETQDRGLADAERLVAALRKSGRPASLRRVDPGSYDGLKMRWFPTRRETDLLAKIDAGEVIGYRINLKPYISTATRQHIPEKGGWADIQPSYVIRNDVILFSGGRLAESLRAVSDWVQTPNMPGKGLGVIDVALSPFWADRQALALISNDEAGRKLAVDRLIDLIEGGARDQYRVELDTTEIAPAVVTGTGHVAIATPLKDFVPPALAVGLTASSDGYAVIQTRHAMQLVSPDGKALRTEARSDLPVSVATLGRFFGGSVNVTRRDPGWNFPTAWKIAVTADDPRGNATAFEVPGEVDWIGDRFRGWDGGYAVSSDGKTLFTGQADGGFVLYDLAARTYRNFPYDPRNIGYFETARVPRFVSSARFSPDKEFIAYTLAHHPSGYGGLGQAPKNPYATEIRLVRASTGQTVWHHEAANLRDSSFASTIDTLAVADGARRVAMIDWNHNAVLFDETGKELLRTPLFDWAKRYGKSDGRSNPPPIRAEIARDGSTALFASGDVALLANAVGCTLARITIPSLCDARLSPDGLRFYVADVDGNVTCFDSTGHRQASTQTQGESPKLAAAPSGVFVAEGAGDLLLLDADGKPVWRTPVSEPATVVRSTITPTGPALYREPQTLATLQKFGAKPIARWEPSGRAVDAFGRKFYPIQSPLMVSATGHEAHLVHLVYRYRAAAGEGPTVTLSAGAKSRTFVLDLPTPEYRVVDLPCEEKTDLTVTLAPARGLEVAELSIHTLVFPGSNAAFVKPASSALDHADGLEIGTDKKEKPDELDVLDDKDPSQVARAASGRMKTAAIFSVNPDPDQVEGHYLRATGNPLDNFDGRKFLDGRPSAWTKGELGPWGSRLLIDLNHHAHPKLCAVYERSLRQSEVMRAIVVLKAGKADMDAATGGPDRLAIERRGVGGVLDNDQFLNVFDISTVEMDALGLFVYSGRGKDHGVSEVELYE